MTTDTTRAALARALDEWRAAGGDERGLGRILGPGWLYGSGGLYLDTKTGAWLTAAFDGVRGQRAEDPDGCVHRWPDLLSALCALAAAGVPLRVAAPPAIPVDDPQTDAWSRGVDHGRALATAEVSALRARCARLARVVRAEESMRARCAQITGSLDGALASAGDVAGECDAAWAALLPGDLDVTDGR